MEAQIQRRMGAKNMNRMKPLYHVCFQLGRRYWVYEKCGRRERIVGPLTKGGEDDYNDFLVGQVKRMLADHRDGK